MNKYVTLPLDYMYTVGYCQARCLVQLDGVCQLSRQRG
jgi:hypothetical protein